MTVHEIEETLATLSLRHQGLDEGMLVTLLLAGGWEKKDIDEAVLIFKHANNATTGPIALPKPEEETLFQPEIETDHRLLEHNPEDVPVNTSRHEPAPVSLVEEKKVSAKDELPHNLPLRPFETSEHIWPFSRYKEVFYGEEETPKRNPVQQPETPKKEEVSIPTPSISQPVIAEPTPIVVPEAQKVQPISFRPQPVIASKSKKSSLGGEDKLVATAMAMLLLILFLLGYMYSNGRF